MAKETSRLNRGIHAGSIAGDPKNAEGAIPFNTLNAPGGFLGQPTMGQSRDDVPVGERTGNISSDGEGAYPFRSGGEKELLGQGATTEGLKDDQHPSLPDPDLPGASGTKNMGDQGVPVDFNSVAEYRYPEFPADTLPQKIADGIDKTIPLT